METADFAVSIGPKESRGMLFNYLIAATYGMDADLNEF
jgi:hypothetical protein